MMPEKKNELQSHKTKIFWIPIFSLIFSDTNNPTPIIALIS